MGTNNINSFGEVLLWSFWIFIWIAAIMIWFRCVFDMFSDRTLSGWGKAGWAIVLIFVPVARCADLPHRARPQHGRAPDAGHRRRAGPAGEVHQAVAASSTSPAEQITHAKGLLDSGAITQEEFDALKAKALA